MESPDRSILLAEAELRMLLGPELLAYLAARGVTAELRLHGAGAGAAFEALRSGEQLAAGGVRDQLIALQRLVSAGEVAAGLVHEVRNIAASVRGFAQVAQERVDSPAELAPLLATIAREAARCADRLNEYLRFAVVRRQRERCLVSASAVLLPSLELVRHELILHEIELVLEMASELPVVRVDVDAVQQVVLNLLLNARQAIERQGRISVGVALEDDGMLAIRIADTGGGIAPEVEHRLFEPFVTTKPSGAGSGLGLAIAREVMREHGGDVVFENRPGEGATFIVRVPPAGGCGG
jgi:signal transduction histidine kinase